MKLYSTNNKDNIVDFEEAIFNSLPQDKGLYMPLEIPRMSDSFIQNMKDLSFQEIAFDIAKAFLKDTIPADELMQIIFEAINFKAPVVELADETFALELFHGPSLAFKDFGARFMSRIMGYFIEQGEKKLDVLVATSGDTGGAVALGFLRVSNTRVTILYPKGKVSPIQELQLTTNAENIRAIEIDGTFDDCQKLVKQAFIDPELNEKYRLTSANSINIARLIPQTFYYFNAYAQLLKRGVSEVIFSVPSGNFGNIGAGILAWKMGLPVKQFIAATNMNDTVPLFLETGNYIPKASIQTYSNAMDVGDPSNWVRIMQMFGGSREELKKIIIGYKYTDEQTLDAIKQLYKENNYVVCPHTAVAWLGVNEYKKSNPDETARYVFLSTAHPCKFPEIFPEEIAAEIKIPSQVRDLEGKQKQVASLAADYAGFKDYLLTAI
ncbi:threonine synthase [Pedobacter sp. HMF7647]|uniref:Threonine synthase n=1 Tax=Hufsiella arboris TaxID=2695275 RepID=A0A7K1Y8Y7_9SPHI|nr:threonine synthase [Hufsiella arboris]MXV51045.1 threonine synthase [Hufsiella arboris]